MRGSIYFQTGELAKVLFIPGMSKSIQKLTGHLANADTIETYREVWNELGVFTKSSFGVKDMQQLKAEHIEAYMLSKSSQNITEQRFELISSAIGKLEVALTKFDNKINLGVPRVIRMYDFCIRQKILNEAREHLLVKETSDEPKFARNYEDPKAIIKAIKNKKLRLAAKIQYAGGARLEAVKRIDKYMTIKTSKLIDNHLEDIVYEVINDDFVKVPQLQGIKRDPYDNKLKGHLLTIEKGGKPGIVQIQKRAYLALEEFLEEDGVFEINIAKYRRALIKAAQKTNQTYNGSHGLRWNFAQRRFQELQILGNLTYEQALQQVSWEMKHERAEITEHYLR